MFTFICLTYNHEGFIIEHLESIKFLIEKFGQGLVINLLIIDDQSNDSTVKLSEKWIDLNNYLFNETKFIKNDRNFGINYNYAKALKLVNTENFKLLAGDDLYYKNDLFKTINFDYDFLVTKPLKFNYHNGIMYPEKIDFKIKKISRVHKHILNDPLFTAPTIFLKSRIFDSRYYKYLAQYKNFEDYPTWIYLFSLKKQNIKYKFIKKIYILYRVGVGISSQYNTSEARVQLKDDAELFYRKMNIILENKKNYISILLKKYLNPKNYYLKFLSEIHKLIISQQFLLSIYNNINPYKKHYLLIKSKADKFLRDYL